MMVGWADLSMLGGWTHNGWMDEESVGADGLGKSGAHYRDAVSGAVGSVGPREGDVL